MNAFVLFCQLVLVYVSYSPYVRGVQIQPGQTYNLEVALKKIYRRIDPFDLQSSEIYERHTHNPLLRFNGGLSYTILTNRSQMIDFILKHIFLVLRDTIGIIAFPTNVNILLKFEKEKNAQEICVEHYGLINHSEHDFEVEKVLAIDNILNDDMQVKEILSGGAIRITQLESGQTYAKYDDFYRFTMYPTGNGPKAPVAMFAADRLHVKLGPNPKFLILEHELAGGAVYFGLLFSSESEATKFFAALNVLDVQEGIGYSRVIPEFTKKL